MISKLEILSQVMLSLKTDQSNAMHNINVLLNNSDKEIDIVEKIKQELIDLSSVHLKIQECESFMLQLLKPKSSDNEIGSSGDAINVEPSEK